jgi:hypothetical protein
MDIINLIENECENDYLDFKAKDYIDKGDFLIDVMSMANSMEEGDKYIIVGVKDDISEGKKIIGVEGIKEQAEFQQLVNDNIEPKIKFEYKTIMYKEKTVGYYKISKDNRDRPYIVKKQYNNKSRSVRQGECYIRKNSINSIALRRDYDDFYNEKRDVKIAIKDCFISIETIKNSNLIGHHIYAPFKINISNKGNSKIIFSDGDIIKNDEGEILSRNRIIAHIGRGWDKGFKLEVDAKDQFSDDIFLNFSSDDCERLNMDELGNCNKQFNVELVLEDTEGNEYSANQNGVAIFAKGDILHKVRRSKGIKEKLLKSIF